LPMVAVAVVVWVLELTLKALAVQAVAVKDF
jgi:hypothetical protein